MNILFVTSRSMSRSGKADQITLFHAAEFLRKNGHSVDEFLVQRSGIFSLLFCLPKIVFRSFPLQAALFWNLRSQREFKKTLKDKDYDRIYFHLIRTSEYASLAPLESCYLGMQLSQALNFSRTAKHLPRGLKRSAYRFESSLCKSYEPSVINKFRRVNFVGTADPAFLKLPYTDTIKVVPHGVDEPESLADELCRDLIFLANFSSEPNKIALDHLVYDLFPKISKLIPGMKLTIAGRNIPQHIYDMSSIHLNVIGSVNDANFTVSQHKIFCNPVKASAGMQNKVVGALMCNIPVVTYGDAIEGMAIKCTILHSADLNDDAFIRAVLHLYENYPTKMERENAGDKIRNTWNWNALHTKWSSEFLEINPK